ncbi:MAG: BBP7 family outer membrane beta-barrel protein [Gemmataceae bacterium]
MNLPVAAMLLSALLGSADPAEHAPAAAHRPIELDAAGLLWWTKASPLPPLSTTSDEADLGLLDAPSTRVILGREPAVFPVRGGAQFSGRYVSASNLGFGVGGFFLLTGSRSFGSGFFPVQAVPIIDPSNGAETSVRLAIPGAATGGASLEVSTRLSGLDASAFYRVAGGHAWTADLFAGLRVLELSESLTLNTTTTVTAPGLFAGQLSPAGSTYVGTDSFSTRNRFQGGQVGVRVRSDAGGHWYLQTQASLAVGNTQRRVAIDGGTTLLAPGQPAQTTPGNIFTQTTNLGTDTRSAISYVPQVGVALGFRASEKLTLTFGYDFLYWSGVARPSDQIDRSVNPSLVPIQDDGSRLGPASPERRMTTTSFWARGVMLGFELTF